MDNVPYNQGAKLIVEYLGQTAWLSQTWIPHEKTIGIFTRIKSNSGWGDWIQYALKSDLIHKLTFLGNADNFHNTLNSIIAKNNVYSIIIFNNPQGNPFLSYNVNVGIMIAVHSRYFWDGVIMFFVYDATKMYTGSYIVSKKELHDFKEYTGSDVPLGT